MLGQLWRAESTGFQMRKTTEARGRVGSGKSSPPITYELAHIFVPLSLFSLSLLFFWYEMERSLGQSDKVLLT